MKAGFKFRTRVPLISLSAASMFLNGSDGTCGKLDCPWGPSPPSDSPLQKNHPGEKGSSVS